MEEEPLNRGGCVIASLGRAVLHGCRQALHNRYVGLSTEAPFESVSFFEKDYRSSGSLPDLVPGTVLLYEQCLF